MMTVTIGQLMTSDTVLNAATDVYSEEKVKVNEEKKRMPKKHGREERLQTIMIGIVTEILDSRAE